MENILTAPFKTKYETAPFEEVKTSDFLPAFRHLIKISEGEIQQIAGNPEPPTFANTIEALAYSGQQLDRVSSLFFNLSSAETSDEIEEIAQEVSPMLSEFSSKISQNEQLFSRIKSVYDNRASLKLSGEQEMLLEDTYLGFVRSGALLDEEGKKKLEDIDKELSTKTLQFGQNVLAATNAYFRHITEKSELEGIPESIMQQYAEEAQRRGLDGFVITLKSPSYLPLMTYAKNRQLRKEIALASGRRAFDNSERDNQKLIREIITLRNNEAQLLGYDNYADFILEERMAKSTAKVYEFLNELLEKARPFAEKEIAELKKMAAAEGISEMQSYDHAYFAEKLRKEKFDIDEEELRPYFELESVQEAVFGLAGTLFGLKFKLSSGYQKYHPDIQVFEVYDEKDDTELVAILYTDYFPREGKQAGAWMTNYKDQWQKDGENSRPHISIVCNFTKPTAERPSLLTFQEVTTLFHEFGHALHGILANTQYPGLSGTSVEWDFVELPSQFLENYCYEPEFVKTFAKHYQTGETLSDEKIEKLSASKNFMEGYQTLRQVGFALLDLAYHTRAGQVKDIKAFENEILRDLSLYPENPDTAMSPTFSHIFQGGYAAGYYSYKWAEVLDADAFYYFKENGIFNKNIANKFKHLLSQGGTKDPMELYKEFRGDEPKIDSLLKRAFG